MGRPLIIKTVLPPEMTIVPGINDNRFVYNLHILLLVYKAAYLFVNGFDGFAVISIQDVHGNQGPYKGEVIRERHPGI